MSDREHYAFIALIDRLRASAERVGDMAFAEALAECFLNVSGGNQDCPIGQLILEDTVRSGKLPGAGKLSPSAPEPPRTRRPQPTVLKRRALFDGWIPLLEKEATRQHDAQYLEALAACKRLATDGGPVDCPIRRLLREQGGGGLAPDAKA